MKKKLLIVSLLLLGVFTLGSAYSGDHLVAVCHKGPNGKGVVEIVIHVAPQAVDAHLAHGDVLGECGGGE